MRRLRVVSCLVSVAAAAAVPGPPPASAAELRSCGKIRGWSVHADAATTTCGLARSATRDYLRKLGRGHGAPNSITGVSTKTGGRYRLRRRWTRTRSTSSASMYRGRAGDARLRVRITGHLY